MRLRILTGTGCDPHENLAIEQILLESAGKEDCTLYLWQNRDTVVIGKNQNAWKECRISSLASDDVLLARRMSGGGAVFHDLGNLNFSFLMPAREYDLKKQFSVIQRACRMVGIDADLSGRNDLTVLGRKFSGSAFYHHGKNSCHHGTILISTDRDKMAQCLKPSQAKLHAKGVDSVRSRVLNLNEVIPDLTPDRMRTAVAAAFEVIYGKTADPIQPDSLDKRRLQELTERNRSWEWNYGKQLPFDCAMEGRFSWGEIRIELSIRAGFVQYASVFTDAMDSFLSQNISQALRGQRFLAGELCDALRRKKLAVAEDLCSMIEQTI